jgi:Lon protease-like protein
MEAMQAKAREKEIRHQAMAAARLAREKEKAEKAAEQASRKAARRTYERLKQALKTSQKGKKRNLKASAKATLRKRIVVRPTSGGEPQDAVAVAPAIQSRRGRTIHTPKRYL